MHEIIIGDTPTTGVVSFHNHQPLKLIAGPCVLESRDHAFEIAGALVEITQRLGMDFVYKTSFDKANRTSYNAQRGVGLDTGLEILADLRAHFKIPVVTDVHTEDHCKQAAQVVDLLQIPAFLCRQTDLLKAAALTGKPLHIKKGQFLAPWDMKNVVDKIESFGHRSLLICERGASFGYNTLVSDMRALPHSQRDVLPSYF